MKRLILVMALLSLSRFVPNATAETNLDYTAVPPFIGTTVTPNILLLIDNSGSMNESAYHYQGCTGAGCDYNPATTYGGYFDTTQCYSYASNLFSSVGARPASPGSCNASFANSWDGNFLNWLVMERIEVAKWVMMGGKCAPRALGNCYPNGKLIFETSPRGSTITQPISSGVTPFTGSCTFSRDALGNLNVSGAGCSGAGGSYTLKAAITSEPQGIIQQIGNKARFGLMQYNFSQGGKVLAGVGDNLTSMVNAIENTNATTWTPLAESLYEAARYFAQITPAFSLSDFSSNVTNKDPYYFTAPDWLPTAQYVPCAKSFVIIFTDGQPTQDTGVPASIQGYAKQFYPANANCPDPAGCTTYHTTAGHNHNTVSNHFDVCSVYYGGESSDPCQANGSHYLDDVAYWAHTTDLRPDSSTNPNIAGINEAGNTNYLAGKQNLTIYTFYAFGSGSNYLKDVAKYGGFNDLNGDGLPGPDSKEWDAVNNLTGEQTPDGIPDTYYESADAFQLRDRLMAAITDILKRSAAGTSVSVLATSAQGEGALYQAYFYPSKFEGINELKWLGYLRGLFLDSSGNMRDDSSGGTPDARLVLTQDRIIKMFLDGTTNEVKANLFNDSSGSGSPDNPNTPNATVTIDNIIPVWEGGKNLAVRAATLPRTVYTFVDSNNNGSVDAGEVIDFSSTNAAALQPYLKAATSTEATNIISFIRGSQVSGYRNRCLTVTGAVAESGCTGSQRVWKLGDIVYSTPTVVAAPREQYDTIYGDGSYTLFRNTYKNRRNLVYVGANDGMLHAFNAGVYTAGDDSSTTSITEHGWFQANPSTGNGWGSVGLGDELWGFVPYDNLPHLKWLTQADYSHVYYSDLKPKITDVRIFNDTATSISGLIDGQTGASHPNGWGTIMIVGMRLGGGAMTVTADFGAGMQTRTFRSGYYAFDITDPEKPPRLLWRFTDPTLGFTTSYPAVVHFKGTPEKWYMVVGSGPDNNAPTGTRGYDGSSTQAGKIFVVDIKTGSPVTSFTTDNNAFMGDPTSVDTDLDYNVDVIYIGNAIKSGTTWGGKVYRLATNNKSDPTLWTLSTLINQGQPLLTPPAISKDSLNNLWVFFGTGRLWSTGDKANNDQQSFYGIKDGCWSGGCTTTYSATTDLLNTSAVTVSTNIDASQVSGSTAACGGGTSSTCSYSTLLTTMRTSYRGWYINLQKPTTPSERVLSPPAILGGIVLFTSFIPNSDICGMLGNSNLYALYYETGTAYLKPVIGSTGTTVSRSMALGMGMPTTIGIAVGKKTQGYVQTSTGTIVQVPDITLPSPPRSGPAGWREKTGGTGTSEVEEIYKHIIK